MISANSFYPGQLTSDSDGPKIELYRHNLTALSHSHNLFVAAKESELHVFEPEYPTQKLSEHPCLIVQLPVSSPNLNGQILPDRPHSINHLLIGELGDVEIILCACDDGDVIAYHSRDVDRCIGKRQYRSHNLGIFAGDLLPFFHENVAKSAWGLAIHKQARKIAISANTHWIVVFSFALSTDTKAKQTR